MAKTGARRADTEKTLTRRRTRRALIVLAILVGILFAGFLGVVAWVVVNAQQAVDRSTDGKGGSVIQVLLPAPAQASARTNVLIAGNSFDDPGHAGAELTDGIVIASVDSTTKKVTLISVPRDLWVDYSGKQMKINAVYPSAGRGTEGLDALGQVVERVTGLHIDKHVLVGVVALKGIVDDVGGIDVTIATSDPRGLAEGDFKLSNGPQRLDGATALRLARARNDPFPGIVSYGLPDSDYSRQESQRMILAAIAHKVKTTPTLANPITVINLFTELSNHMTTDFTVGEIKGLYETLSSSGDPKSLTIRGDSWKPLITNYTGPGGSAALVPIAGMYDYSVIQSYVEKALAG